MKRLPEYLIALLLLAAVVAASAASAWLIVEGI